MNRKLILTIIFFNSLVVIGILAIQIKIRRESDVHFGANYFDGKVPRDSFKLISNFSTIELSESKTILILFDPSCEACYSQISSFCSRKSVLSDFNIVMASDADSIDIALFVKNFKFEGFKSIRVGRIDKKNLNLYTITYPTVLMYDKYGDFLKGFRGSEDVERIIQ